MPDEQVVEVMEFETDDDLMRGEMMVTFTLSDADGGTEVLAVHRRGATLFLAPEPAALLHALQTRLWDAVPA